MLEPQGNPATVEALESQSIDQYIRFATLLSEHPGLAEALEAVADRLIRAREAGWTGRVQVNIQTGEVMGGPEVRTA